MRDPKTKVACLKLTVSEAKALDALVAYGTVISRSDALRVGLDMLIERFPHLNDLRRAIIRERDIRRPRKATKNERPKPVVPPTIVGGTTSKLLVDTL